MIGDAYFDLRSRLSAQLHALAEVIRDLGGDTQAIAILENLIASLKEPFVFVVVGEVNVGKSTFLNALFGQDFSRTGIMPTTEKILFFKHGAQHQVVPITSTLDEVHVPAEFLRDFHIVDTPGTNSIENEHQQITERFVPIADLVIFVFSAMNPWGASAWQFLDKVHKHWMRNVVFVLQQCDLRSPEEIQVITDYMKQLSRQRFGQEFPLFPVSAKKAYMARSSGLDRDRLLEESGFLGLEGHISALVGNNATRMNKLANTARLARQLLEQLRERITAATTHAQRAAALVRELQTERELQVDRTLKKILPALDATERDYHESCIHLSSLADQALATRRAFAKNGDEDEAGSAPQSLDHRLFQDLQHRTGDRWKQVGIILEEDFVQYQRFLHAQGKGRFLAADEPAPAGPDPELRRLFSAHIDSTIRRFVLGLELDRALEPGLAAARKRARWVPWLLLPVTAAIAAAWYFAGPPGAGIAAGAGLLVLGLAFLITQAALNRTRRLLLDKLDESAKTLRQMLSDQVRGDIESLFGKFVSVLAPAEDESLRREQTMVEQAGRVEALVETLAALDQQIRAVPARG
ncbi:MAG TPA: dynamin family protein [Prosthecobacter sp.]|nr:dynamin family protein [Prosthecobacter sp.]